MSLTFDKVGYPIARIINTTTNKPKFLYLDTEGKSSLPKQLDMSFTDTVFTEDQIVQICTALGRGFTLSQLFNDEDDQDEDNEPTTDIELSQSETMLPLPQPGSQRINICSVAGAGKSTLAAKIALEYKLMYPDNNIHLFCRTGGDPAFDIVEHEEIVVDDSLLHEDIKIQDLANSLVIFDDIDNLQDKKLSDKMHRIINDVLCNGRKLNIHCIYIGHTLMNGHKSKVINNESSTTFMFNGLGNRQNAKYLAEYCGMNKGEIDALVNMPVRWFCICRSYPRYIIHEKGAFIL